MRALIVIGCGALAAACASQKPNPAAPAHFSPPDSTTVTMQSADAPDRTASRAETDDASPTESPRSATPTPQKTARSSQFSTLGDTARAAPPAPAQGEPAPLPGADNSGTNKREQTGAALTPMDQGNSDVDLMVTQQIRKAIVENPSISFNSQNVKVITQGGKVTLRGVVKTPAERKTIDDAARKVAGASNVDDQLDVEK